MSATAPLSRRLSLPARDVLARWNLTVPGLLTVFLGFRAGGFFPGTVGLVGLTLSLAFVLCLTLVRKPLAGWGPGLAVAAGAVGGYAIWQLVSATWSHAPARALSEFDRTLLYGLVLLLTGSAVRRGRDVAVVLRWAALAFTTIAVAGLLARLLPATFPTAGGFLPERLAFPVTYWNAMGLACALGFLLCLHLTASGREPAAIRVLAAAAIGPLLVTMYLTFSRGALWVLPVGVLLYVLLGQPRGLVTGGLAALIPAAIAVKVAYDAELLARADYDTSPAAAAQGHHVAIVVALCTVVALGLRAAALPLDARLHALRVAPERLRVLRVSLVAGVLLVLVAGGLLAHAPRRFADFRSTFSQGSYISNTPDLRQRLTSAVDNGRIDYWRVALDGFKAQPLHGSGAGTYQLTWELDRPAPPLKITDGHSLYLETLSELGVPGLVLVLVALATLLGAGIVGLRGPERHAYAAFVAGGVMLALHAGIDWDWEMPVLFVWLFGAGGAALAGQRGRFGDLSRTVRIVAALAVLVLALTPALFWRSQGPLDHAVGAFAQRDCATAISTALTRSTASACVPSRGRSSATATPGPASTRWRGGRWTRPTRATRTTGGTSTGRPSSTASPGSTRARTPRGPSP